MGGRLNNVIPPSAVLYTTLDTQLGRWWLARTEHGLCRLAFGLAENKWFQLLNAMRAGTPRYQPEAFQTFVEQVEQYLAGERRIFTFPLDIRTGTPFQRQVWQVTREIPYGQVTTYQKLAQAIGRPKASRAVGNALAQNPLLLVIPCHRVLRADGSLGGFAAGPALKRILLQLEGALP